MDLVGAPWIARLEDHPEIAYAKSQVLIGRSRPLLADVDVLLLADDFSIGRKHADVGDYIVTPPVIVN